MELLCVNIALPLQLPQRKAVKLIVNYSNFLVAWSQLSVHKVNLTLVPLLG